MKPKYLTLAIAVVIAAVSATLVAGAAKGSPASLQATQICDPMSIGYDVNDSGTAAGYVGSYPNYRAVTCSGNALKYLDLPGDATKSIAVAINSSGQAVGQIDFANGQEAVVWDSSGAITRLGFLPGGSTFSSAQDINDDGHVVGVAGAGGHYHGFVWDGDGPIEELPTPSGMTNAFAQAINNDGALVGSASVMYQPDIAVLWDGGAPVTLTPLVAGASAGAPKGVETASTYISHPEPFSSGLASASSPPCKRKLLLQSLCRLPTKRPQELGSSLVTFASSRDSPISSSAIMNSLKQRSAANSFKDWSLWGSPRTKPKSPRRLSMKPKALWKASSSRVYSEIFI